MYLCPHGWGYTHDRRADKYPYPHDRRADSHCRCPSFCLKKSHHRALKQEAAALDQLAKLNFRSRYDHTEGPMDI